MAKLSKRKKIFREEIDAEKSYSLNEAYSLLKKIGSSKFDSTVDIAVKLGIDPKKSDQNVRGATTLPSGNGKEVRVAVFAQGEVAESARSAGADVVGMEDLAEQIKGGDLNFGVIIATPESMRVVGALGKILAPKGLMPNPKTGTVTSDVELAVKNAKSGQVRFRADKSGIVHGGIGKLSFDEEQIKSNVDALVTDLRRLKPASSKGVYIKKIFLSTTMGPGVLIDVNSLGL